MRRLEHETLHLYELLPDRFDGRPATPSLERETDVAGPPSGGEVGGWALVGEDPFRLAFPLGHGTVIAAPLTRAPPEPVSEVADVFESLSTNFGELLHDAGSLEMAGVLDGITDSLPGPTVVTRRRSREVMEEPLDPLLFDLLTDPELNVG